MMACPYKARSFIHETLTDQKPYSPRGKGTVESCTFCVHRVDTGETPACVEACTAENHNAMVFGDMKDPSSEISQQLKKYNSRQIRADLQLNTGVRYRGI
jgi:molybdopterin-containing oxidoreductase family iron-sulfur binding subunit